MAGEGGLLVGYGGCGRPGLGLGCAESLPGVPRLYEDSRVLQDVKIIIVYQKLKNGSLRLSQMAPQAKILTFWDSFSIDFALEITISMP